MIKISKSRQFTMNILMDAFWQLYKNQDIEKITIKNITDKAGYNRITFYDYFKDIYDVLDCFENKILSEIKEKIHFSFSVAGSAATDIFTEQVIVLFNDYRNFLVRFFSDNRNKSFEVKLANLINSLLINYSISPRDFNNRYILEFYTSGLVGAFRMWFRSNCDLPLKTFLYTIYSII